MLELYIVHTSCAAFFSYKTLTLAMQQVLQLHCLPAAPPEMRSFHQCGPALEACSQLAGEYPYGIAAGSGAAGRFLKDKRKGSSPQAAAKEDAAEAECASGSVTRPTGTGELALKKLKKRKYKKARQRHKLRCEDLESGLVPASALGRVALAGSSTGGAGQRGSKALAQEEASRAAAGIPAQAGAH